MTNKVIISVKWGTLFFVKCLCIDFDRKWTEIVHLWFPKIHTLLRKEGLLLCDHQKLLIYFCKGPLTVSMKISPCTEKGTS